MALLVSHSLNLCQPYRADRKAVRHGPACIGYKCRTSTRRHASWRLPTSCAARCVQARGQVRRARAGSAGAVQELRRLQGKLEQHVAVLEVGAWSVAAAGVRQRSVDSACRASWS